MEEALPMSIPSENNELRRLLDRVCRGEDGARHELLGLYRTRLRRMVAVHLDLRLSARIDPSDVVQEALACADRRLGSYLRDRPIPFYPWLRAFARDRLLDLRRRHVRASCRSVAREEVGGRSDPEARARRLEGSGTSPSGHLIRAECRDRVRGAIARLEAGDREVLALRQIEGLSAAEAAAVLGVGEEAIKSRHRRALERLRALLVDERDGSRGGVR
jgi:RNA polymerase sigma-70 factor (ECF subfamily)